MRLAKLESILRERKQDTVKTQQMYEWVYLARQAHEQEVAQLVEVLEKTAGSLESLVRDNYEGTTHFEERMHPVNVARQKISRVKETTDG